MRYAVIWEEPPIEVAVVSNPRASICFPGRRRRAGWAQIFVSRAKPRIRYSQERPQVPRVSPRSPTPKMSTGGGEVEQTGVPMTCGNGVPLLGGSGYFVHRSQNVGGHQDLSSHGYLVAAIRRCAGKTESPKC